MNSFPKNCLTEVRIQASFILKGEGVWLVGANFLVSQPFVLAAAQRSGHDVSVYLQQILFSVLQLFISMGMEKCHTFKGQSLENGLPCIFQATF